MSLSQFSPPIAVAADVSVGGEVGAALLVTVMLTTLALIVLAIARPWELRGSSFIDKLRIGEAVSGYDFWLSLRGVGARRRRELRTELRGNLWEATQHVGVKRAITAVGPLRSLANDSVPVRNGPRWGSGIASGLVALEVTVALQLFLLTVVADTADAAGVAKVDVPITLVPGMSASYAKDADGGLAFSADLGPTPLVLTAVIFVFVSRPWRLVRSRARLAG